jgi:cytochrome c oxidase subunit 2
MKCRAIRLLLAAVFAMASAEAAERDFSYCLACHGTNGNGNPEIRAPKIAGIEPWYLRKQLTAFESGFRATADDDDAGHEMQPVAVRVLNEKAVDNVLAFVKTLPPRKPVATVKGDATKGERIYSTCASCHGLHGEGNEAIGAPALAQRTDWYLLRQLDNFAAGARGANPADTAGMQMRAIAATLKDPGATADVVAYIATLP